MGSIIGKKNKENIEDEDNIFPLESEMETTHGWVSSTIKQSVLILTVIVFVFTLSAGLGINRAMRLSLVSRTENTALFLTRYVNGSSRLAPGAADYVVNCPERDSLEMQLLGLDGTITVSSSSGVQGTVPYGKDAIRAMANGGTETWVGINEQTGELVMASTSPIFSEAGAVVGAVRCVSSMATANKTLLKLFLIALLVMAVIVVCVAFASIRLYRKIMVPISRINDTAQMIAEGTYGVHINTEYPGEIGELCHTLNDMSDAISRSEKLKNDFISSVSHELRTPLTAIGGWGETLLAGGPDDAEEVRRGLNIITNEAGRLTRMVEELLDFSRMESGSLAMRMERIDFTPDIQDVVFMYMEAIRREGITLEYDEGDDLPEIIGDRNRLRQVFLNLLDNAIKHGGEGKRVRVEAYTENQTLIISVRDFGAGIPSDELPHVKERFYKGKSKARGSGIGLAVADEIMKLHGGRLDINSVLGEGTVAIMVLPAIIGDPESEMM